ncbi:META domain-containing protein [Mycobacteroides abscessus]
MPQSAAAALLSALAGAMALLSSTVAIADTAEASLLGTRWMLVTDQTAYFELDQDGRLSGSDSCNRIVGSLTLMTNHELDFGNGPVSTRMYCDDISGAQSAMQAALTGKRSWHRVGDVLTLINPVKQQFWIYTLTPDGVGPS